MVVTPSIGASRDWKGTKPLAWKFTSGIDNSD
jgi:hypothetical protein